LKVTLDLTALLAEGKITQAEYDRFAGYAATGTGSLAFNILVGFGVIAVAAGLVALVPDPTTGIVLGGGILAAGLGLYWQGSHAWEVLAHICVLVGALMLAGGIVIVDLGSFRSFLIVAVGFAVMGVLARSSLLIALAVLALSACIGAQTGYLHAMYFLGIEEPTLTIVIFAILALAAYQASQRIPAAYEPLAIAAARTSIFLVNFGFWIGSLWGDKNENWRFEIPDTAFVIVWAVALIAVGVWAARVNRRWLVNVAAVFGAIHFYTQWFERLGPNPLAVVIAGLIALAIAVALFNFNRHLFATRRPAVAG
jgi:iron complex transport system permease protein